LLGIFATIQNGDVLGVMLALDLCDVEICHPLDGRPIISALCRANMPVAVEHVLALGADINKRDAYGRSPVHWAVLSDDVGCLQLLIDAGADLNTRSYVKKSTPLHLACTHGYSHSVRCLLDAGADYNIKDSLGLTPVRWARNDKYPECVEIIKKHMEGDTNAN